MAAFAAAAALSDIFDGSKSWLFGSCGGTNAASLALGGDGELDLWRLLRM